MLRPLRSSLIKVLNHWNYPGSDSLINLIFCGVAWCRKVLSCWRCSEPDSYEIDICCGCQMRLEPGCQWCDIEASVGYVTKRENICWILFRLPMIQDWDQWGYVPNEWIIVVRLCTSFKNFWVLKVDLGQLCAKWKIIVLYRLCNKWIDKIWCRLVMWDSQRDVKCVQTGCLSERSMRQTEKLMDQGEIQ